MRTRTFVAIPIDAGPMRALTELSQQLGRQLKAYRWVDPQTLHITLAFLGDVVTTEIPEMCKLLGEEVRKHSAFDLTIHGVGAFPDLRRARTLWAGVAHGTEQTLALQRTVVEVLEVFGYRRESRPFTPHFTIGRLRRNTRPDSHAKDVLTKFDQWDGGVSAVTHIHMMGSELSPAGPKYTVLGTLPLGEL